MKLNVGISLSFEGVYVYVSYFLTGENRNYNRSKAAFDRVRPFENFFRVRTCGDRIGRGLGAWQIAVRGSYGDYSDDDIDGGVGKAITVGLNWFWTPHSRMQFNYIHGKITNSWARGNATAPDQPLLSGTYDIIGARFMVNF